MRLLTLCSKKKTCYAVATTTKSRCNHEFTIFKKCIPSYSALPFRVYCSKCMSVTHSLMSDEVTFELHYHCLSAIRTELSTAPHTSFPLRIDNEDTARDAPYISSLPQPMATRSVCVTLCNTSTQFYSHAPDCLRQDSLVFIIT